MRIATAANSRTAEAARQGGVKQALPVAFRGGAVMGFTVAGLGLLGVTIGFLLFTKWLDIPDTDQFNIIAAIGLGGSSIALFARVGGGIYTKAADVGADLVGKVEAGIPEDDPRNPAVIADAVGDNVGDVAGMGADLYRELSSVRSSPRSHTPPSYVSEPTSSIELIVFPMAHRRTRDVLGSIIGSFLVKPHR